MHFTMDEGFSLGDLMRLGLHHHVEACAEIVDRAEKELGVENALKKIEDAWGSLSLAFAPHQVLQHQRISRNLPFVSCQVSPRHAFGPLLLTSPLPPSRVAIQRLI